MKKHIKRIEETSRWLVTRIAGLAAWVAVLRRPAACLTTLAIGLGGLNATVNTFDTGIQGWSVVSFTNLAANDYSILGTHAPSYVATGSNPGGFIRANDPDAGDFTFAAPAAFLSGLTGATGATFSDDISNVSVMPAAMAEIVSFGIPGYAAVIDGTHITWILPPGTNVTALAPTFMISTGASADPPAGTVRNFATPQSYGIRAGDGSVKNYTVTATVAVSDGLTVKTFDNTYGASYLDPISNLMAVTPSGTFTQFGNVEVTPGNTAASFPGLTGNDTFSILWEGWFDVSKDGTGSYTFGTESDDGSVICLDLNSDGDFADPGELIVNNNPDHVARIVTNSVTLDRDAVRIAIGFYENSLAQTLTARFKKGSGLAFGTLDPITGTSGRFFSSIPPANPTAANLWNFGLPGNPAVMSGSNIVLTVPYGTNVAALSPTFTISAGAGAVPPSGTVRNFATPQTYTVNSADSLTTRSYTVTVLVTPTWIRYGNGLWSTTTHWGGGNVANGTGGTADFNSIDITTAGVTCRCHSNGACVTAASNLTFPSAASPPIRCASLVARFGITPPYGAAMKAGKPGHGGEVNPGFSGR